MTNNAHKTYLANKHAKMVTPHELVVASIQRAVGSQPESITRILKGNDHEVYDVVLARGSEIIVRIAHQTEHRKRALPPLNMGMPASRRLQRFSRTSV